MSLDKVLFVDDEENLLSGFKRQFHKQFQVDTQLGGEAALQSLTTNGPYTIIVSDLRMPGMDGIQFLQKAREIAPDSVRIMLTGNSDVQTAIEAVNEGNIFRFLTKPCPPETLEQALNASVEQHRLIMAERELLEKTLNGSVRMLIELLSITAPQSFGHAEKVRNGAKKVAAKLGLKESWELDVASMLCQIGLVTVPSAVIENAKSGRPLNPMEQKMLARVPEIGRDLLNNIPRMELIARIVEYQNKHFDGTGLPQDDIAAQKIPIGSRILKAVNDLLQIENLGIPRSKALHIMKKRAGWYDPEVFEVLDECIPIVAEIEISGPIRAVSAGDLQPGMVLAKNFHSADGLLLVGAGCQLSDAIIAKIRNVTSYAGTADLFFVESSWSRFGKESM